MKEVALFEAKNRLSALVAEVEETGEEIVITRHGKPAARIAPVARRPSVAETRAVLRRIRENAEARARSNPAEARPSTWEDLKTWMEEDR